MIHVSTIRADRLEGEEKGAVLGLTVIIDGEESLSQFRKIVQRGTNLWPDAHPDVKAFADIVTNDKILQDYEGQAKDIQRKKKDNHDRT